MAEAGTWKPGRRPVAASPPRDGGRSTRGAHVTRFARGARTGLAVALTLVVGALPYLTVACAGVLAGLAVAAAVHALAGRTLFDVSAEAAGLFLVAAPLLGLLPLSWLLLLAPARPALLERVPRLLVAWGAVAGCTAFWYGIRPFLR